MVNTDRVFLIHQVKSKKSKKNIEDFMKTEPYYLCIRCLRNLEKKLSPVSKMRMVLKTSEYIQVCIKNYLAKLNVQLNNYFLDSDDVLSIFNYIVAKSQISNLHTHMHLISKFTPDNSMLTVSGYYLTTMQATITNLLEQFPQLSNNSLKINNNEEESPQTQN